jgi:hypothetical protein
MTFNFAKVEAAQESSYLKPGVYTTKISEVKLGKTKTKNTEFLGVTFETEDGLKITESFMLTEKALPRIQYLHEAWAGKKLDKAFKSTAEIEAYFAKTFVNPKAGTRNLVVGGEINGKNTYGTLPYTGFIIEDGVLDLGEFEEGSEEWKKYVKKSNRTTEASGQKNGILNDNDDEKELVGTAAGSEDEEDTPW